MTINDWLNLVRNCMMNGKANQINMMKLKVVQVYCFQQQVVCVKL